MIRISGNKVEMISGIKKFFLILRPHHWIKSLLILFPPFFAGRLFELSSLPIILPALASFSLIASCTYIINDIKDAEYDKNHQHKRHRAIAHGDLSIISAILFALFLFVVAIFISRSLDKIFQVYLIAYVILSLTYSFRLKEVVIVDIFVIAFGFLMRVLAGGRAFDIVITSWLFLTVFIVALFLAAGKRLGELISMGENAQNHRKNLIKYSYSFLEGVLWFSASASLVTYALYTLEHMRGLFYTVPLAAFGLLRYIYIVKDGKGDPTEALIQDRQIFTVGIVWLCMIGIIIYK